MAETLSFYPPNCCVDPGFWEELYNRKVNIYKLDDSPVEITAVYGSGGDFCLGAESFSLSTPESEEQLPFTSKGVLFNYNTIESFKDLNKKVFLQRQAAMIYPLLQKAADTDGSDCPAVRSPELLNTFVLIVFADLKAYKFTYWFGMPAFIPGTLTLRQPPCLLKVTSDGSAISAALCQGISQSTEGFHYFSRRVFALRRDHQTWKIMSLQDAWSCRYSTNDLIIVFVDNAAGENDPYKHSWGLRNLLALFDFHCSEAGTIRVLSVRNSILRRCVDLAQSSITRQSAAFSRAQEFLGNFSVEEIGSFISEYEQLATA